MREKETYALVSCLLKFKSWISGRKVTAFTDHKSLESWYKENLCTMAGPLGRCSPWHEFLSRYNIVVVYKPGKDNDVPDGMSRWAYPAGLADDTTFHGLDADLKGYEDWKAQEKARNDALFDGCPYLAKGVSLDPPAAIRPSAMVTAAGTAICARPATTPAFIMSVPAWKRPLRTSWMPRGRLMLCSFRNTGPR